MTSGLTVAKKDPNLLTQAEYARSRKSRGLPGGSREAVRKAVDAGRISAFGPDKLVDPGLADRQWAENTRVRAANDAAIAPGEPGDLIGAAAAAPAPEADAPAPVASTSLAAEPGYQAARAREAEADARMKELKLAETEGQLVRVDQVRAELAGKLAPVREALLQLPSRIASTLASQSDPARVQTVLEAEIHAVLAPLGRMVETPAS